MATPSKYLLFAVVSSLVLFSTVFGQSPDTLSPAIDCSATPIDEYSVAWHVGSVFILLVVSGIGIFTTLTLGTTSRPFFQKVIQVFKMFGIGVIAATGWCHLLPDAFEQFSNPCLDGVWTEYGPAFVGVFALAASFLVQLIELFSYGHGHHGHHIEHDMVLNNAVNNLPPPSAIHNGQDVELEGHFHEDAKFLSLVILEAGILFHSLAIGLTLGVTSSFNGFMTLLVAMAFHQLFEGLALGALISNISQGSIVKFGFMGMMYPLTTPVGIAIGIGVHSVYNGNSSTVIIVQGIFDSLSAGILMYNTYTELISVEINHNKAFRLMTRNFKVVNMLALYAGAAAMALLARWA